MGWSGGGEVVGLVILSCITELEYENMLPGAAARIVYRLVAACRDLDWDTAHETLGLFQAYPFVVEGFRMAGVELVEGRI